MVLETRVIFVENFLGSRRQMQSTSCSSQDQAPPSSVAQIQVPEEHLWSQSLDPSSSLDYFQITLSWAQSDHLPLPPPSPPPVTGGMAHTEPSIFCRCDCSLAQSATKRCLFLYAWAKSRELRLKFRYSYKVMTVAGQEGELWLPAGGTASPGVSPSKAFASIPTRELSHLTAESARWRAESANWEALNARGEETALVTRGAFQMAPPQ